jgi:serine O-acetyltransferase
MPDQRIKRIATFAELRALWREDFETHRRRWVEPGFHAIAVHRFGVWIDGLDQRFLRAPLRIVYFALNALIELCYGIRVQYQSILGRRVRLAHAGSGIIIARDCILGDDCLLRQNVTLGALNDRIRGGPRLGNRVEIGANAVVIGPITVGDDVVIGPNTVVRSDVPPASVVLPPDPVIRPRRSRRKTKDATDLTSVKEEAHEKA